MNSAYKCEDGKVVVSCEGLDKDYLAIASKQDQNCTYRDEESQHASELFGTVIRHDG